MPQPRRLNPDLIADAALTLIEADGIEALTMRKLGAALGVEAMSIYSHLPSKSAVLDAAAARLLSMTETPPPRPDDWRGWMRAIAANYRRLGLARPKAFPLLTARRYNARAGFAFFEANLKVLRGLGLDARDAIRVARVFGSFLNGALLAEIATRSAGAALKRNLPDPAEFPLVAESAPFAARPDLDGVFDCGVEFILEGIEALARGVRGAPAQNNVA
jgi:AcrR family transcriptional regulator